MAGLKMNVEFPTRLCEVEGKLGYFHLWEQWSNVVDAFFVRWQNIMRKRVKRHEHLDGNRPCD